MDKPEPCQEFTAIGIVMDDEPYLFHVSEDFCSARHNIDFLPNKDVSILPLINSLNFIKNKKSWGYSFRFSFFEIKQDDFDLISSLMLAKEYA